MNFDKDKSTLQSLMQNILQNVEFLKTFDYSNFFDLIRESHFYRLSDFGEKPQNYLDSGFKKKYFRQKQTDMFLNLKEIYLEVFNSLKDYF